MALRNRGVVHRIARLAEERHATRQAEPEGPDQPRATS
jgi:hypothetical protein